MRASRSCPRSSVPSGCAAEGPWSIALKSMSLTDTGQNNGPNRTPQISRVSTTAPPTAMGGRRNRRQAPMPGETCFRLTTAAGGASGVGDARVEPAIKEVRNQVEDDDQAGEHEGDRHDHGGVVGQNGVDQQRADAGIRKICSVTTAPPKTIGI